MARALEAILKELNNVYNPQRDVYNAQITEIPKYEQADLRGLEAAKTDSFNQITTGANRRGLLFSGIPLQEQAQYTGATYLPSVANLKAKYATQRFNLQDALAQITRDQQLKAEDIYQTELNRDVAARAARASSGGGGGGGGLDLGSFLGGSTGAAQAPARAVKGAAQQLTLRQQWQKEAKAGDWNAQVALNYAGDDGRYDGPVNSQDEFNRLRSVGIVGNYYVRGGSSKPTVQDQLEAAKKAGAVKKSSGWWGA